MRLAVLIPSRNRPDLVQRTLRSVLCQVRSTNLTVVVSDNSSPERRLRPTAGSGYGVIRPDREMAMAEHWAWDTSRLLESDDHSHLMILTDRLVLAKGAIGKL